MVFNDYEIQKKEIIETYLKDFNVRLEQGRAIINLNDILSLDFNFIDYIQRSFKRANEIIEFAVRNIFDKHNEEEIIIHYIPYKKMPLTSIEDIKKHKLNTIVRLKGMITSSTITTSETYYEIECDKCHFKYRNEKKVFQCKVCKHKPIPDENQNLKVKDYRIVTFQENYSFKVNKEVIELEIPVYDNDKKNFMGFDDYFGAEKDILAIPYTKNTGNIGDYGKKSIYTLKVVGIQQTQGRKITESRAKEIKEFIKENNENIIHLLSNHIFCDIYGFKWEKQALLLNCIGLHKEWERFASSQMKLLIISDAGKGKTSFSNRIKYFFERARYLTASLSSAGALGGVIKIGNEWVFTVGELALANNSVAILDEIDKLDKEISDSLLTVLSEGIIKVSKIKQSEMKVHINFILLGNPIGGEFDEEFSLKIKQINLSAPFIDRADFIIFIDNPYEDKNEEQFDEFCDFVLAQKKYHSDLNDEFVKDILIYYKSLPNPIMTKEAIQLIKQKFKEIKEEIRRKSQEKAEKIRDVSARTLKTLQKIVTVVSRMKDKNFVDKSDVEVAYEIYNNTTIKSITQRLESPDLDMITLAKTGESTKPRTVDALGMHFVNIIKHSEKKELSYEELEKIGDGLGFDEMQIEKAIHKINHGGWVLKNRDSYRYNK